MLTAFTIIKGTVDRKKERKTGIKTQHEENDSVSAMIFSENVRRLTSHDRPDRSDKV